jgi:uncharacterized paraquat-inducible protein A
MVLYKKEYKENKDYKEVILARGTVHNPEITDGEVDCPNCDGTISLKLGVCGRCGTKVTRLYKRRRQCVRMTYRSNGNGNGAKKSAKHF